MPFVSTYQPALESNRKSPFTEHIFKRPLIISYTSIHNNQDYEVRATTTRKRACEQLQKFGDHEQASTRLNFASKSSKGKILRAVKNFNGPFITPNDGRTKRFCSSALLCASFTWQIVKITTEGPNARDQSAFCAFHSFLVGVRTNAGYIHATLA